MLHGVYVCMDKDPESEKEEESRSQMKLRRIKQNTTSERKKKNPQEPLNIFGASYEAIFSLIFVDQFDISLLKYIVK